MQALLLVMLGGALGAGARHLVGRAFLLALGPAFPWGTLTINVTGSLLMGLLVGALLRFQLGEPWRLLLAVGVLGGFTTFSSFALDATTLWERGAALAASGYVLGSVVGGLVAINLALWVSRP